MYRLDSKRKCSGGELRGIRYFYLLLLLLTELEDRFYDMASDVIHLAKVINFMKMGKTIWMDIGKR